MLKRIIYIFASLLFALVVIFLIYDANSVYNQLRLRCGVRILRTDDALRVFFTDSSTDESLRCAGKYLGKLGNISSLLVQSEQVSDLGISELVNGSIEELRLITPRVSDVGITKLAAIKQLRSLTIEGARLSGEGLKEFGHHPNLETVNIQNGMALPLAGQELAAMPGVRTARGGPRLTGCR